MNIINPIYDQAVKYLMQNERLAKKVLSTILEQEVVDLSLSSQETVVPDEKRNLSLFRMDFKAVVRYEDGSLHTVLIEMQKSKYSTDIRRFRTYLGQNYITTGSKQDDDKSEDLKIYPIITIYILGYDIQEIEYMAVSINNDIIDSSTKKSLNIQSDFIELLNHRSHIIQVNRLPEHRKTKLEKLITLFNQAYKTSDKFILDIEEIPEEFRDMASYLQGPIYDEDFRNRLRAEEEIDYIFDEQERKYLKKIEDALAGKENERLEKEKALSEKNLLLSRFENTVKALNSAGMSTKEISKITGLSAEQIEVIIGSNI